MTKLEITKSNSQWQETNIENLIYDIRGVQVMLDSDLAKLYQCKNGTKTVNQAVKRHINRFPERFMFQLTKEEFLNLKSQVGTSSWNYYGGVRKLPYVFTEEGVAMLATVLRTEMAEKVSVAIMDAFVKMRKIISNNILEQKYYNDMIVRHDGEIKIIQDTLEKFEEKEKMNEVYFDGKYYDAYSRIKDIFFETKKELIIVDNYADKILLDMLKNLNVEVIIITSKKSKLTKLDIEKYNKQYNNVKIIYNNSFHDRFIIVDKQKIYHSGTSFNYIGSKIFVLNLIEEKVVKEAILSKINLYI